MLISCAGYLSPRTISYTNFWRTFRRRFLRPILRLFIRPFCRMKQRRFWRQISLLIYSKVIRQISRGEETGLETYQNQHTRIQMTLISSCHLSEAASMSKSALFLSDDSVFGWQQIFCLYFITYRNQHTPIQITMISTCYLSETANVSEFLASCATTVFEGKNGKTEQKTNTYVEARDRY